MQERSDRDGLFLAGDAVRGLACVGVVVGHVYLALAQELPTKGWSHAGGAYEFAVTCTWSFFIMSGYLVGGPFARRFVEGRGLPRIRTYAARRLRRILPAFWILLALLIAYFGARGANTGEVIWTALFQQNQFPSGLKGIMAQGWTLDIEAAFYVGLPILFLLLTRLSRPSGTPAGRRVKLLVAIAVTFAFSFFAHADHPQINAPTCTVFTFWYAIAPGMVLAVVETPLRARMRGSVTGRGVAGGLLAGGVGVMAAMTLLQPRATSELAYLGEIGAASAIVAGALSWQWATGSAPAALRPRGFHAMGRWSYSIYLLHVGVGIVLIDHLPGGMSQWVAFAYVSALLLAICTAAASLMWWLVEQPALLGRRPRWPVVPVAGAAKAPATLP